MLSVVLSLPQFSSGYVLPAAVPLRAAQQLSSHPTMGMFDGLSKAFENDDTLGAQKNAGLSKPAVDRVARRAAAVPFACVLRHSALV